MPVVFFITHEIDEWTTIPKISYFDLMQVKLPRVCFVDDVPTDCLTEDEAKRLLNWGENAYESVCGVVIFIPQTSDSCFDAFINALQPPCNPRYLTGEE